MIHNFAKTRSWILLLLVACTTAQSATLQAGSIIPIRLTENVNGNMISTGETIFFEVIEDISADQELVIPKGTLVRGKVLNAEGRKSVGRGGKLSISPVSLETPEGKVVLFDEQPLGVEGRNRTGATVAHVVAWGVLGFLAKGRAAFILRDTEYEATVRRDVELNAFQADETSGESFADASEHGVNIGFDRYKKKINFRKGKVGKDFWVFIQKDDQQKINGLEVGHISITHAEGFELPQPIQTKQLGWSKKKERYVAIFDYSDIIRYAVPGNTQFTIRIDHGDKMQEDINLETKWKLK